MAKTKYTYQQAKNTASKYIKQQDFRDFDNALYQFAKRNHFIKEICSHMQIKKYRYNENDLIDIAKKYNTRSSFQYGNPQIYNVIRLRGKSFLDRACAHMVQLRCAPDTIYIVRIENTLYNNKNVYKIGITSSLSNRRLNELKNSIRCKITVIDKRVVDNPRVLEKTLLEFGDYVDIFDCYGKTEFRALSDSELVDVLDMIDSYVIVG